MHDKNSTITASVLALAMAAAAGNALAANPPPTAQQRATAQQAATRGVPLSELAPNAPESYVVRHGDTLWGISGMYLQRPWRWPELWGMNLSQISNPHLIYPGQTLYLDREGGMARLRLGRGDAPQTVRVSPRTRYDSLAGTALPTIKPHLIEPFLSEPLVVDEFTLAQAPRIVATRDERVLMSNHDRAYVRGPEGRPLVLGQGVPRTYRVFRNAVALKDPDSGEVLGYEAQYVGQAELVRSESTAPRGQDGTEVDIVPATVDLSGVKEEIRPGDRLLPAPSRSYTNYVPHAPQAALNARVTSIYGDAAVAAAGANQVITINRGEKNGVQVGHVLQLLTGGQRIQDKTGEDRATLRLPQEANGTAMVFRVFDRISYALILQAQKDVRVGDTLVNPEP